MKNHVLSSCLCALLCALGTVTVLRAQIDNRNYLYASNHNLAGSNQSGIVRIDKRSGEQVLVTQGQYLADNDLFGLIAESPTTLLAMDVGMGSGQKIVRVNVTTMQQEVVLQTSALESPCFATLGPDGFLYVSNNGWMGAPGSIIKVNLATRGYETLVSGGRPGWSVFHPNGYLYYVGTNYWSTEYWICKVDVTTRQVTRLYPSVQISTSAGQLVVDTDGSLLMADYGTSASGDSKIVRIDPNSGNQTLVSPATGANQLSGLWVDSTGQLFALDTGNPGGQAAVWKVDRATGVLTIVSPKAGQAQLMWNAVALAELPAAVNPCAELQAKLDEAYAMIVDLNGQLALKNDRITFLQSQLSAANQTIQSLTNQVQTLTSRVNSLTADLSVANATIDQLTAEKLSLKGQVITLTQSLATANATIQTLQAAAAAAGQSMAAVNAVFRTNFNDPSFAVPGASLAQQIQSLATGISALNHGQQQALYRNLGGKK